MSTGIVITKPGTTADYDTHCIAKMLGADQVGDEVEDGVPVYDLTNPVAKAFIQDVSYNKTYVIAGYTTKTKKTTNGTKWKSNYESLISYNRANGKGGWTEQGKPIVISGTKSGRNLTFTSTSHTMVIPCQNGATAVYNLVPGQTYNWIESNTSRSGTFKTTGQLRMLNIGIPNCRDLGGWVCDGGIIKYEKLIRGMGFSYLTGNIAQVDAALHPSIMTWLQKLNVGTDLDLRNDTTTDTNPNNDYQSYHNPGYSSYGIDIDWVNIPIGGYTADLKNKAIKSALEAVVSGLDRGKAVWFHCSTAADRAGTLAVIIMAVLGCSIDSVVKDYDLTRFNSMGYGLPNLNATNKMGAFLANIYNMSIVQENVKAVVGSSAILNTSTELRDKMISWLMSSSIGVGAATLTSLRSHLIELSST